MNRFNRPKYYNGFECIAGACEDNCCMGWHVDIDKKTYEKYKKIDHPQIRITVKKSLRKNENYSAIDVDFATVKLTKAQNCAFLTPEKLCLIQKEYGESYLSNVCSAFPRIFNSVNGTLQMSLSPACPEALRKYLFLKEGIAFENGNIDKMPSLLSYIVNEKDVNYRGTAVEKLALINRNCIEILKDRTHPFETRLYYLGEYIDQVKKVYRGKKDKKLLGRVLKVDGLKGNTVYKIPMTAQKTKNMLDVIYKTLSIDETVISQRYLKFYYESQKNWLKPSKVILKNKLKYDAYFDENTHIFENYFVNLAFRNIFPFTEADDLFSAFLLFLTRYLMMRRELVGFADRYTIDETTVTEYFQSFSKAIEHHHYFYTELCNEFESKQYGQWDKIKGLFSDSEEA